MNKMRWVALAAALAMAMTPVMSMAETTVDATSDRGIVLCDVEDNPMIEGESPVTGRTLADLEVPDGFAGQAATGRYMPMMTQIDNADGGVGYRAPWGAQYADVVYETPLYEAGDTRISFIFSDLIPDAVGPVRSARVGHVWIREEWDCGFMFYGGQEAEKTNIYDQFKLYGADKKGVLFSGIVGDSPSHPWKKYYYERTVPKLVSPHNKGGNAAAMIALVPEDHTAANHTWLFTDEPAEGDAATEINVLWRPKTAKSEYNSRFVWDEETNSYLRYTLEDPDNPALYVDLDDQEAITFNNVIIQFTETTFYGSDAPLMHNVGEGNADFFMNGVHVAGYWKRADMSSRTVYYDADGNELELQRGRTMIIMIQPEKKVTYQ